jgi:hypothetical protein
MDLFSKITRRFHKPIHIKLLPLQLFLSESPSWSILQIWVHLNHTKSQERHTSSSGPGKPLRLKFWRQPLSYKNETIGLLKKVQAPKVRHTQTISYLMQSQISYPRHGLIFLCLITWPKFSKKITSVLLGEKINSCIPEQLSPSWFDFNVFPWTSSNCEIQIDVFAGVWLTASFTHETRPVNCRSAGFTVIKSILQAETIIQILTRLKKHPEKWNKEYVPAGIIMYSNLQVNTWRSFSYQWFITYWACK